MEESGETENTDEAEEVIEERISLNEQRLNGVADSVTRAARSACSISAAAKASCFFSAERTGFQ